MKLSSVKTVGEFMRYCKMPYSFQSDIKKMKVGDIFMLGKYTEPFDNNDDDEDTGFVCEVWIEKNRGSYSYFATWTLPTKKDRPLIMMQDEFIIEKAGLITFKKGNEGARLFSLVCRYINQIILSSPDTEKQRYRKAGVVPFFRGVWMDKDYLGRRYNVFHDGEKLARRIINYSNYAPSHQLQAVVTAGLALRQIK
ncbi:hypothetical protein [Pantoea ananatis]|uniref:hypothetical protein n=1 Tax=Pantoea ananas TaxID=553 RepID=UPI001B315D4F|nr:hypothetical protein [Pantoea ananatis]